ncbi:hypothetical protein AKJ09_09084 [Labilithrix luteola]|uniref:Gamma-glutamyltranspeptidase n=1 Tax=Labilithrix luteola TaxID=1391654 RepID=A0A0K1Q9F0_9BACT|nr:hypothetical protein [Labilithrix luteola]AKV02421.1 hypothetical protein AKJ09_09084 [Labilithrix luteola]
MTLRKQRAAVASTAEVEAVAEEVLRKGNAVDAVVAGVFAACAISPGVLLGPVQMLIGGAGVGLHAFDGRVRQPGIGAPRPRGFQSGEEIPAAARIGVPWLPATLAAATATAGNSTFAQVLAPAIAIAKGTPREDVLKKIASHGPRAMEVRPISSELLFAAGRPNGGLLTADDLASANPSVLPASKTEVVVKPRDGQAPAPPTSPVGRRRRDPSSVRVVVTLPWAHVEGEAPVPPAGGLDVGHARAIAALDRNGTFAIAVFDEGIFGTMIDELGLRAPFCAEPVRRGITRLRPGDVLPAAAAIALVGGVAGPDVAFAAFGASDAYDVLGGAIRGFLHEDRIEAHGEARLVALAHADGAASVFR